MGCHALLQGTFLTQRCNPSLLRLLYGQVGSLTLHATWETPFAFFCARELTHFSCVRLFVTPWIAAHQAPLSKGFSRQEYQRGLPCPLLRDLLDPGIEPLSLIFPALEGGFFTTNTTWEIIVYPKVMLLLLYLYYKNFTGTSLAV